MRNIFFYFFLILKCKKITVFNTNSGWKYSHLKWILLFIFSLSFQMDLSTAQQLHLCLVRGFLCLWLEILAEGGQESRQKTLGLYPLPSRTQLKNAVWLVWDEILIFNYKMYFSYSWPQERGFAAGQPGSGIASFNIP